MISNISPLYLLLLILVMRQMLRREFWAIYPLLYLNVLSFQHTAVHAVDSRGEEARRRQAAQGNGYNVTPLHSQHRDRRLLLCWGVRGVMRIF